MFGRVFLYLLAFYTLVLPASAELFLKNSTLAWILLLSAPVALVIVQFDRVTDFSLGPLKAKMRETIQDAVATLDQLRKVASSIANSNISQLAYSEFSSGMPLKEKIKTQKELIEHLKAAGLSDEDISLANQGWKRGISHIYHLKIAPYIDDRQDPHQINSKASLRRLAARKEFDSIGGNLDATRSPSEMRAFVDKHAVSSEKVEAWISDYEHFLDTGEIRRVDIFCDLKRIN